MPASTRRCPGMYCTRRVQGDLLTCPGHWFMIPAELRKRVRDTYAGGQGKGSPEHDEATTAAVDALNAKILEMARALRP